MKNFRIILWIVFLAGCSSNQPLSATAIPTTLPASSPLPTETILPAIETLTPTSVPSSAFTSIPFWTPLPTLPAADAEQKLRIWIDGAFDCLLPCWAGITPGKTTWRRSSPACSLADSTAAKGATSAGYRAALPPTIARLEWRPISECQIGLSSGCVFISRPD